MKKILFAAILSFCFILFGQPVLASEQLDIISDNLGEEQGQFQIQIMNYCDNQEPLCFADIANHWAKENIIIANNWGLIEGYPDGCFYPDASISGSEGLMMLRSIMKYVDELPAQPEDIGINIDLIPLWARSYMQEEMMQQIAGLCPFYGEKQLKRLDFAVGLAKILGLESDNTITEFYDQDSIPVEYQKYLAKLNDLGIVLGNKGYFYPNQLITRAESATMLIRALSVLNLAPVKYTIEGDTLTVILEENPSTGYRWAYEMDTNGIVNLESDEYIPKQDSESLIGAGGQHKWVFQCLAEGTVNITFYYYRPWEDRGTAIDIRALSIKVLE